MIYENILTILAQAAPQSASQNPNAGMGGSTLMIYMVCFGVIFYFMIIRPQSQKQKQQLALISSIKTGDKVIIAGGIHGIVANVKDATVMVKVADNVKLEVDKASVTAVTKRSEAEPAAAA